MTRPFLPLTCLMLLALAWGLPAAPAAAPLEASTWTIDSVHSCALFRVRHGPGAFWGRFNDVKGTATFDPGDLTEFKLDVEIPIEGVDSGHPDLDRHLRSPDFFNETEFPLMRFEAATVEPLGDSRYTLKGTLTLLGTTAPIEAPLEMLGTANSGKGMRAGLETSFTLTRSDFGMDYGTESGLGDSVRVVVALELVRSEAQDAL